MLNPSYSTSFGLDPASARAASAYKQGVGDGPPLRFESLNSHESTEKSVLFLFLILPKFSRCDGSPLPIESSVSGSARKVGELQMKLLFLSK
ncbi:hypothetical protein Dfer_4029 [Dyadobacter fermentans DSM 18053]|uniref:Uncharacterized protein n=1 Tax=Dyadobacter fermentans (strain ATCC 700827 / DSM 18053 / CIP 107007 / KCTC 52180 / NS114) TaxID=471854 RepID=C6VZ26_DYAFD|nr:hypothetical protein Dfer_4029 [Dyadobacter fermentans DSM 18053]